MIVGGIDVGSLSTKSLILTDGKICGWHIILTGPIPVESAYEVMDFTLRKADLSFNDLDFVVSTGYGRINVPFARASFTEISCQARGSNWLFPSVRTILDVGGQDCKAIRCDGNGDVIDFTMNDKCAAGTGRYLERVAKIVNLSLDQIGSFSLQSVSNPVPINSTCVVFAESDIIKAIRSGKHVNDVLAGAMDAIVNRIVALLERVGVDGDLCISGGVAKNIGVVSRLEQIFKLKARIAPEPQIVGALGAALIAMDLARQAG